MPRPKQEQEFQKIIILVPPVIKKRIKSDASKEELSVSEYMRRLLIANYKNFRRAI